MILIGVFHGELDMWVLGIDVLEQLMTMLCLSDNKSVTYILEPKTGDGAELMALTSNSSMYRVTLSGLMGEPMAAPWTCSKYLPWKRKWVYLRQNSRRVMIWGVDIEVLLRCKVPCYSLC